MNVHLFNLSLHVLTLSFFLGKHVGKGERMQHELLSGDIMAGAPAAAPGTSLADIWEAERRGLIQLWSHLFSEGKPG